MSRLVFDITMSLDGFVAGPNRTLENPLGEGGEGLHDWMTGLATFQERHGRSGGARNADDDLVRELFDAAGAFLMGRNMYSGGEGPGPWADDPNADGWWGSNPPFHRPVFVLTHHPREPLVMEGGTTFTFVTEGIEAALDQARAAAEGKDVSVAGGADVARQYLEAGLLDELRIHVAPLFLGGGVRLFDRLERPGSIELEATEVIASPLVTHLRYSVR